MTPQEYIEKLKEAKRILDSAKEDLDRAIYMIQRRIETGDESMEQKSRLSALAGYVLAKTAEREINEVGTVKIEYR